MDAFGGRYTLRSDGLKAFPATMTPIGLRNLKTRPNPRLANMLNDHATP